jgi:hypothetical protein
VEQQPSREKPVIGSVPHGSSGPPSTLRSGIDTVCPRNAAHPPLGTVIPEGRGGVKRLLSSGLLVFRSPGRQHWVRAGVKTERPQRSEDERLDAGLARWALSGW